MAASTSDVYQQLSYGAIVNLLKTWSVKYPNLIKVYNAQDTFGIASPGACGALSPCKQYYFRITNGATLPDIYRPEVFFSGALHGNERVGPTSVMEFARILLENYIEEDAAKQNVWLKKLVDTRSIYIMPSANALGYFANTREENGIDPNRDFPYNQEPEKCMKTTAARAINELWRKHIFQLSLTFHAGETSIDYEWGAYNHPPPYDQSPDERGFKQLAETSSNFASRFGNVKQYPTDRLGRDPYDVNGGMEDWAYAASWETEYIFPCKPSTAFFNGYAVEKTKYNNVSNRAMNFLVETSVNKDPPSSTYGTRASVFNPSDRNNNGHVSRNIRLALMMTEMVQPYIYILNENQLIAKSNTNNVANDLELLKHSYVWDVGGSYMVDETNLVWAYWPKDLHDGMSCHCFTGNHETFASGHRPGYEVDPSKLQLKVASSIKNSPTRWINQPDYKITKRFLGQFSAKLPISGSSTDNGGDSITVGDGKEIVVFIRAKVDSTWGKEDTAKAFPKVPPQTHVVQSRINPGWHGKSDDGCHGVQGSKWVYSKPICITNSGENNDKLESAACNTFLKRFKASQKTLALQCPDQSMSESSNNTIFGIDQALFLILIVAIGIVSLGLAFYCKYFRRYGFWYYCRNKKLDSYIKSTDANGFFDDDENSRINNSTSYQDDTLEEESSNTIISDEEEEDGRDAKQIEVEMVTQ
eukprot:g7467.t1